MCLTLVVLGLSLGSFINALVWRIHAQSKAKSKKQLQKLSILKGRSMCPECRHQLAVKDLLPVVSWLSLKGKCRYCKKPISWQYPLVELLMPALLITSWYYWPYQLQNTVSYLIFAVWIIISVLLVALAVYDVKWMLLPSKLTYPLAGVSILFIGLVATTMAEPLPYLLSALAGGIGLGGLFWLLYHASDGKWIGGGDVRLGFVMGGLLGWQKSVFGLMTAAYLGTLIVFLLVVFKKYHRKLKVPFGPLLISGLMVAFLWGEPVIEWYKKLAGY